MFVLVSSLRLRKSCWLCHTEVPSKWTPTPCHFTTRMPVRQLLQRPKTKQCSVVNRTQTSATVCAMYTVVLVYEMYKHTTEPIQRLASRVPFSTKYSRVFWQICSIFSREPAASSFILKGGGSTLLIILFTNLSNYTASHSRKPQYYYSPPWWPEITILLVLNVQTT